MTESLSSSEPPNELEQLDRRVVLIRTARIRSVLPISAAAMKDL
jgi:hypothetical protein